LLNIDFAEEELIMQSNHKDDAVEHDGGDGSRAAPGWEDDASLEDIETVIEPDQQEMQ
jgi:hypothetical protein